MRQRRGQSSRIVPYQGSGYQEEVIIPEVMNPPHAGGQGYGSYGQPSYHQSSWRGSQQRVPVYAVDPSAPYSIFTALRVIASAIRRRGPFALAELAVAGYVILAGSAFALNMVANRPMRLTNVPIFDPTATGANIAWFMRPVLGTAADMGLDAQVNMFSDENAEVKRDRIGQSQYAVEWEPVE